MYGCKFNSEDPNGGISFNLKSLKISAIAARNSKKMALPLFLGA